VSTSFETPVDQWMPAALVSALEDLTSAVSSQSESLDGLGAGPDQRISGDSVLFSRIPPLRVVVSVVLEADLYAELEASGCRDAGEIDNEHAGHFDEIGLVCVGHQSRSSGI